MDDGILRVIGTHHKTGTVLLYRVFRDLSRTFGLSYFVGPQEYLPNGTEIWFEDHSRVQLEALTQPVLGVHVIRHPYEILASAYRYHLVCGEEWCVSPGYTNSELSTRPEFRSLFGAGRSYQEVLRSLPPSQGLTLEIWRSRSNIIEMVDWDYANPRFLECRLEEFSADFDGTMMRIFTHLGLLNFGETALRRIAAAHDLSLRSGRGLMDDPHVTNTAQRRKTFNDVFEEDHFRLVGELFPADLVSRLGYEAGPDDDCY